MDFWGRPVSPEKKVRRHLKIQNAIKDIENLLLPETNMRLSEMRTWFAADENGLDLINTNGFMTAYMNFPKFYNHSWSNNISKGLPEGNLFQEVIGESFMSKYKVLPAFAKFLGASQKGITDNADIQITVDQLVEWILIYLKKILAKSTEPECVKVREFCERAIASKTSGSLTQVQPSDPDPQVVEYRLSPAQQVVLLKMLAPKNITPASATPFPSGRLFLAVTAVVFGVIVFVAVIVLISKRQNQ